MKNLIKIEEINNELVTSSRTIAQVFGKEHKEVMRDIKDKSTYLIVLSHGGEIAQSKFENSRGQLHNEYLLNEQQTSFVIMSYTGSKAQKFKVAYIKEFERMKQHIQVNKPITLKESLLAQIELIEQNEKLEFRNTELTNVLGAYQKYGKSVLVREFVKIIYQEENITIGEREMWKIIDCHYVDKKRYPYAQYKKYFEITSVVKNGSVRRTLKISPKGILYFTNKILKMGE